MSLEKLVSLIVKSIPYSDQISFCEFSDRGEQGCSVLFNWRSSSYIVSCHGNDFNFHVGEYVDGCSVGTDASLILRSLLRSNHICGGAF